MVKVDYSHLGEDEIKRIKDGEEEYDFEGELMDLIAAINSNHPGFRNLVIGRDNKILSSVRIYKNIKIEDGRVLDNDETKPIYDIHENITNDENVLFSIYNAKKFAKLLEETLKTPRSKLEYTDPKRLEPSTSDYKKFLEEIKGSVEEGIKKFESGNSSLKDLLIPNGKFIDINIRKTEDITDLFDRKNSKLLPESLIHAIMKIWELDSTDTKLYAHQEDALFYILGKLHKPNEVPKEALLLSIPTGGGKTEAFLIPIISHIYDEKSRGIINGVEPEARIIAIITYPTKALANDQANRIVEILYEVNKNSNPHQQITLGILTGDTPWGRWNLKKDNLIQVCPSCKSSNFEYPDYELQNGRKIYIMECKHCGYELTFVRLTREDILAFPPDILITNLDMINYCLQSPKFRPLFRQKVNLMVFDEVHLCESVFGCHAGHLLRRLEATNGYKPLYIGVSATIKNAEELSSLIFDVDKDNVLYLSERNRPYLKDEVSHYRYHYVLTPHKWKEPDKYLQVITATLNTGDVVGHAIRDPHFRKTLVFSNYRQDTDNLVKYLRDQEDRYFIPYKGEISQKLALGEGINETEKRIAEFIGGWYEYLKTSGILYDAPLEVGWHRGGLEQKERLRAVTRFSSSRMINWEGYSQEPPVDVMMATKTLEVGIDIGDVSNVFNCSAPFTVNEYVQRVGRGGRKKDSTAVTIIDPTNPLDFYFQTHFEDYVIPERREFEDAPIIITNESIAKNHLYARILEFVADDLEEYKREIKVEDLKEAKTIHNGEEVRFMDDPELFAEAIFEKMMTKNIITEVNETEKTALERYLGWFEKEHELLNVRKVEKTVEEIRELFINKCRELRDKINSKELGDYDFLSGLRAKDTSLVPRMRGSGAICRINLIRERGDETKDHVNRRRALTNMPPGGFTTQGANTFRIDSLVRDPSTEIKIRNLLSDNSNTVEFFQKQFDEYFPRDVNNLDLRTPTDLQVRYYPFRFYCSRCGKTYTKPTDDDRCTDCSTELRQLTEVYLCEKCGEIFEPPVPKVCINPDHLEEEERFIRSLMTYPRPKPEYDIFKFRALPELHWQCKKCKATFNFHQKWSIDLPESFLSKDFRDLSFDKPIDVAKHYQYRPESVIHNKQNYISKGLNPAHYSCDKCETKRYNTIKAKNVPTVRSVLLEYILQGDTIMERENLDIGYLEFKYVDVIALSREYVRKFYTKESLEIRHHETFLGHLNSFLANTYNTHAAFLNLSASIIDEFLSTQSECLEKDCENCKFIKKIPDSKTTMPSLILKEWERNRIPDVRRKWCTLARERKCENDSCLECPEFIRRECLKYLLIHTLKHALILAMPKYTGINKNEVHGIVYPNDETKPELVFLDVHEDGSGSVYLMKRNWKQIWDLSEELMKNAREGRGSLLLPHFCERHNRDLCPILGAKFYEFLRERGGG